MNTKLKISLSVFAIFTLTACGGAGESARSIAQGSLEHVGCKTSQSEMWNTLHQVAETTGAYPEGSELRTALIEAGFAKNLKGQAYEAYVDAFVRNYTVTIEGIKEKFAPSDLEGWKKALAEMEIGIRVTDVHAELNDKIASSLSSLSKAEKALGADCEQPVTEQPGREPDGEFVQQPKPGYSNVWEQFQGEENPEVYGARLTFATAYQSCDVLKLPAMTTATPSVSGITILAESHPAGGRKRVYGSIASINSTHYYVKGQRLAKNSCFEVRNSPLIYDFGGKPGTSSSKPKLLDMFRSAGTGTEVLGIDCSAYVFSALALAGLKMDPAPEKVLKADLVHGIGSRAFKEPQSNGLRCLQKVTMTATKGLEAGDIAAINGHVVMIDEVGADPFGLKKITKVEDCNSSKIVSSGFDFVIAQSSPSKSGIGINRYEARDYLKESSTYKTGLTNYAVAACKAKFGVASTVDTTNLSLVRHKKTPECKAEALSANKQECVDSCQVL